MERYKVTIGIPIYNVEKYIERNGHSVLGQSYTNLEIIFVNDCTQDNSIALLTNIIRQYPNRQEQIKIIHHNKNRGLAAARNSVIENSTGDFILWVDSDDFIEKNAVEILINAQNKENSDIVQASTKVHHANCCEVWKKPIFNTSHDFCLRILSKQMKVCVWGMLIRLSLYKENGIKTTEGINMSEDYQVTPKLAYYAKRITTINDIIYHYECSNVNAYTHTFSEEKCKQHWDALEIIEKYFQDKGKEYIQALNIARAHTVAEQMLACTKEFGHEHFYRFLKDKSKEIDKKTIKQVAFPMRIILSLPSAKSVRLYVKIATTLKQLYIRYH